MDFFEFVKGNEILLAAAIWGKVLSSEIKEKQIFPRNESETVGDDSSITRHFYAKLSKQYNGIGFFLQKRWRFFPEIKILSHSRTIQMIQ